MNPEYRHLSSIESTSSREQKSYWIFIVRQAIFHILTIVSIVAFLVTCICMVFDHTKFLKSDDPFIIGGLVSCLVGFYLSLFHSAQVLRRFHFNPVWWYIGISALPALFFIVYDNLVYMPEGQGVMSFIGVVMFCCSLGVVPLGYIQASKPLISAACFSATIYGTGYLITYLSM